MNSCDFFFRTREIRDQAYDEKQNTVTIVVVCCSPEKIRDKICSKGGGSIKSIEIVEPKPKPKEPEKKDADKGEKPKPKPDGEKKDSEKKKDTEKPKADSDKPKGDTKKDADKGEKPKDKPADSKPKSDDQKPAPKIPDPVPVPVQPIVPPPVAVPVGFCVPSYDGPMGGPSYGYGGPPQWYDGYYARPVYDSYGGGRPCYVSRCDQYFSDENPSGCSIM